MRPSIATTARSLQHLARSWAGNYPPLFERLVQLRGAKGHLLVRPDSDLVIEGFPRSGNTFAVAALLDAQPTPVAIARHLHVPSQLRRAAQWRIPALVLVREPSDAVVSLSIREPHITLRRALLDYLRFHHGIAPLGDRFVVGTFDEVVGDFGTVVERLNRRFGTAFVPYRHSEEADRRVFDAIDAMDREDRGRASVSDRTVSRPSEGRDRRKAALIRDLHRSHADLLERARELHAAFVALAAEAQP